MSKRHALMTAAALLLLALAAPGTALAQDVEAATNLFDVSFGIAIAAGFGMAIASAVCGIAQARSVVAACEGIARNPSSATAIRGSLIIGLVLIESLAIYTLLVSILLIFLFNRGGAPV